MTFGLKQPEFISNEPGKSKMKSSLYKSYTPEQLERKEQRYAREEFEIKAEGEQSIKEDHFEVIKDKEVFYSEKDLKADNV